MKLAVVLFNLGGPDSPAAVEPFLCNLFSDPAIISLPSVLRRPLAWFIAKRRAPLAREIYAHMGGRSPILPETQAQARALERALAKNGHEVKCFIAMRYWHPQTAVTAGEVKAYGPDEIVLLPLYPQYSTTTTQSSLAAWRKEATRQRLTAPSHEICCYPIANGLAAAIASQLRDALIHVKPGIAYRVLFSAHGLPKRIVEKGDPYQWQVEQTVAAILAHLGQAGLDAAICYQSRVGPLEWIGPSTTAEIARAGREGKGLIVVPVAFVSEHSETLVELDIEYAKLAREERVPHYVRVPTVRTHPSFIGGLAGLVLTALGSKQPINCSAGGLAAPLLNGAQSAPGRLCPKGRSCGHEGTAQDA